MGKVKKERKAKLARSTGPLPPGVEEEIDVSLKERNVNAASTLIGVSEKQGCVLPTSGWSERDGSIGWHW